MCLNTIIERSSTIKETGKGWKVFSKSFYGYSSIYQGNNQYLPNRQWIHELGYRSANARHLHSELNGKYHAHLHSELNGKYPFGWHIYVSKKAAEHRCTKDHVAVRVRYRRARTRGRQGGVLVIVAKEMFIEGER